VTDLFVTKIRLYFLLKNVEEEVKVGLKAEGFSCLRIATWLEGINDESGEMKLLARTLRLVAEEIFHEGTENEPIYILDSDDEAKKNDIIYVPDRYEEI
jgi:hypothetical protein